MFRNVALWLIIGLGLFMMVSYFGSSGGSTSQLAYSEFIEQVEQGYIKSVTIKERVITGETESGGRFETFAPDDTELMPILREHNVRIDARPPDVNYFGIIGPMLIYMLIIFGFMFFFMRQMQGGGGNKAFSFGKSKARMLVPDDHKITFKDVAGVDEAKEELQEVVEFLKDPQKFQRLGGKIPKGVLLVGSPGTGKTLLAKAVAGEAGVAFFSISGSDFVEMFVGVGAARIRDLFEQGKKNAPCIIFMDEIDAVGRHRGAGLGGGHDEREQTLNALLVEMDGFESSQGVILIAATNRPDVLDPALLRPGRFDRQVVVPLPDLKGRRMILEVHVAKVPLSDNVNLDVIAKGTPGFSGAALANLVNEAAIIAARFNKDKVEMADMEEAKDKVMLGKERRSLELTEETKNVIAYHESGHAIVYFLTPGADPVHKVTIVPRGVAYLGATYYLPKEDVYIKTKEHYLSDIVGMMGGRAAEKVVFNQLSSGANGDIKHATDIARTMVTAYGMSDILGPVSYAKKSDSVFLGKELSSPKDYSEATAVIIDEEVKKIIEDAYAKAVEILTDNKLLMDKMAEMLIEKETIDSSDVNSLMEKYVDEKWRSVALATIEKYSVKKA